MRILLITIALWTTFLHEGRSESDVQCPYQAVVDGDDLHVRSGPGTKYYPTGKLQSGQKVTVRRLDPGGWLMIDPPEGSFSLIPAAAVERNGENSGTVIEPQVKVVMGSDQEQSRAVTQCELNQGDTVEILGEKLLAIGGPSETWYQIRSPQGEYRWVHGKYITPVDGLENAEEIRKERRLANAVKKQNTKKTDPEIETVAAEKEALPIPSRREVKMDRAGAVAQTGPALDVLVAEREKLKAIDHEWELMLERSPGQWHLDDMEKAYRDLQSELTVDVLKRQIDYRLESLKEHRQIYQDFADFQRITEATDRRDQELQEGFAPPVVHPAAHEAQPAESDIPPGTFLEAAPTTTSEPGNSTPSTTPSASTTPPNPNQFVLTGRLIRTTPAGARPSAPNTPQFALVGPNNQVLAFLHATPQIGDLTGYINREVGINGSNWSRPGQPMNVYSVTQIAPLDGPAVRDSSTPQFAMPTPQPNLGQQPSFQSAGYQSPPQVNQFYQQGRPVSSLPEGGSVGQIQPVGGEQPFSGSPISPAQFQPGLNPNQQQGVTTPLPDQPSFTQPAYGPNGNAVQQSFQPQMPLPQNPQWKPTTQHPSSSNQQVRNPKSGNPFPAPRGLRRLFGRQNFYSAPQPQQGTSAMNPLP